MARTFDKQLLITEKGTTEKYDVKITVTPDGKTPAKTLTPQATLPTREIPFDGIDVFIPVVGQHGYFKFEGVCQGSGALGYNFKTEISGRQDIVKLSLHDSASGPLDIGAIAIGDTDYPPPYTSSRFLEYCERYNAERMLTFHFRSRDEFDLKSNTAVTTELIVNSFFLETASQTKSKLKVVLRHSATATKKWVIGNEGYKMLYDDLNDNLTVVLFVKEDTSANPRTNISFDNPALQVRDSDNQKPISVVVFEEKAGIPFSWPLITKKKIYFEF